MSHKYFTTPIYYVNGDPHIGHCYTGILTDVLVRNAKMQGHDVRMQTGTDEHGNKVEQAAKVAGFEDILSFCTMVSNKFRDLMVATNLSCTYDNFGNGKFFIRTTDQKHKISVQNLWQKLNQNGWIYKDVYKGWYAIRDEAFYDESEIVDGKAPSGAPVEWKEEEAYFFKLSSFQKILINFYETNGASHLPNFVKNEIISFLSGKHDGSGNLRDLCISRIGLNWGIRVPNDEKHAVYVWLDALQNYVSALENEKEIWWDNADKIHVIGKDIVRFHAIYWPAFLLGQKYTESSLPNTINSNFLPSFVVHGWWLNNGQKMSKSLNNSLDPYQEIDFIKSAIDPNIPGVKSENIDGISLDYFRYFLIKAMPSGNDGNYNRTNLIETVNADLVNNIGNLVNRVCSMVFKNKLENITITIPGKISFHSDPANLIQTALKLSSDANAAIEEAEPWNMLKNNSSEFGPFMKEMLEIICQVALLIKPITPIISNNILDFIGINNKTFINHSPQQVTLKHKPYPITPRLVSK